MFNFEEYEDRCKSLVKQIHDAAVVALELEHMSYEFIGGKLVGKELNKVGMTMFGLESDLRYNIFEMGDSD